MVDRNANIMIEDAEIVFRNFSGKEDQYNREGNRNFSVILPNDVAAAMQADGWNIKTLKAREDGDEPRSYIQVNVSYKGRPPKIVMITSRKRQVLGEDLVELLDSADIVKADILITPYHWEVRGETGVKAYLKTMFVTIQEDELELKYASMEAGTDGDDG